MYVMSVDTLLERERMEEHQTLVEKKFVQKWTPSMIGRVIFVSHEWLGWDHADPHGYQFSTLKTILQRLMQGTVPKVESYWIQQVVRKKNTVVVAAQWMAALPHMFVCPRQRLLRAVPTA